MKSMKSMKSYFEEIIEDYKKSMEDTPKEKRIDIVKSIFVSLLIFGSIFSLIYFLII